MVKLKGHFDGRNIVVVDDPVPQGIPPLTPVTIIFDAVGQGHVLDEIAKLAVSTDELPPDYAEQHEHYVKGTPRK